MTTSTFLVLLASLTILAVIFESVAKVFIDKEMRDRASLMPVVPLGKVEEVASALDPFESVIEDARRLLRLKDDGDGEGALQISVSALHHAVSLVRQHADHVSDTGDQHTVPEILPGPGDGSLDVIWKCGWRHRELLVNVPADTRAQPTFVGGDYESDVYEGYDEGTKVSGKIGSRGLGEDLLRFLSAE